jgi:hypothetical protein
MPDVYNCESFGELAFCAFVNSPFSRNACFAPRSTGKRGLVPDWTNNPARQEQPNDLILSEIFPKIHSKQEARVPGAGAESSGFEGGSWV